MVTVVFIGKPEKMRVTPFFNGNVEFRCFNKHKKH